MSVLIRSIEIIPASCMTCLFQNPYMGGWCSLLNDNSNAYNRRHDCPLVLIPPHGRLIDADKLKPYMLNEHYKYRLVYDADEVANAPTIIPAEEGE